MSETPASYASAPQRTIKVGHRIYHSRGDGGDEQTAVVPFIRLSGRWLEDAGFHEGDGVVIHITQGEIRLVVRKRKPPAAPRQGRLFE